MPRVSQFTLKQKEEQENKQLYKEILDHLNSQRGRECKTDKAFEQDIGIGKATWAIWKKGDLSTCRFENVLNALSRCGVKLVMTSK